MLTEKSFVPIICSHHLYQAQRHDIPCWFQYCRQALPRLESLKCNCKGRFFVHANSTLMLVHIHNAIVVRVVSISNRWIKTQKLIPTERIISIWNSPWSLSSFIGNDRSIELHDQYSQNRCDGSLVFPICCLHWRSVDKTVLDSIVCSVCLPPSTN